MSKDHSKQRIQHERSHGDCGRDHAFGTSAKFCVHRTKKSWMQEREVTGSETGAFVVNILSRALNARL